MGEPRMPGEVRRVRHVRPVQVQPDAAVGALVAFVDAVEQLLGGLAGVHALEVSQQLAREEDPKRAALFGEVFTRLQLERLELAAAARSVRQQLS